MPESWEGEARSELRSALAGGSFEPDCFECKGGAPRTKLVRSACSWLPSNQPTLNGSSVSQAVAGGAPDRDERRFRTEEGHES